MYIRVVRFTDVTQERIEQLRSRIAESGGPPEGVDSSGIQVLFDSGQGTAVVLQHFATVEDMQAAAAILEAMDASETPGTRASVDAGEVLVDLSA